MEPSQRLRRPLTQGLAAICLTALTSCACAAPARAERSASYGTVAFNAGLVPGKTVAQRTAAYRRLRAAGVQAIRLDLTWVDVERPDRLHRYDFTALDRAVAPITAAGLKVIGILDYGNPAYSTAGALAAQGPASGGLPPFAVGNAQYFPPDHPADFARYVTATVRHFAGRVVGWEVWNEENEGYRFWEPREDPAAYGRLLCAAHAAVRAVDPRAPVVFGGVFFPAVAGAPGTSGPDFVRAAYDAVPGLGRCFDVLAYHPYAYPFTAPELDVPARGSVLSAADEMRAVLAHHRDAHKPLWITEVGWPTSAGYGVSEVKQAQYAARMQAASFAQGIPLLTWYTYGDDADPTGANQEAHFGFFRQDGSAKPAYRALVTFARVFRGARFIADRSRAFGLPPGRLLIGGRGFALAYRSSRATITALWLATESAGEAQGPLPAGGTATPGRLTLSVPVRGREVTVIDYFGPSRRVRPRHGRISLALDAGPVYLVDAAAPRRGPVARRPALHRARRRARFTG